MFYFINDKKIKRGQMSKKKNIKPTMKNPLIDKFKAKRGRYFTNVRRHSVRRSLTLTFYKSS